MINLENFHIMGGNIMFCKNCGTQCGNEENYCHKCGTLLNSEVAATINNPEQVQNSNVTLYVVLGWTFFGISLLFIPILFGAGAVIMGYLLKKNRRETHGTILMILGVAGAILGALIGMALYGY